MLTKLQELFKFKNKYLEKLFVCIIIFILSSLIMTITFIFSSASWDMTMFLSYFSSPLLLLMNFIPIFLLMILLYFIFNRLWLSYLLTGLLFISMSIVNRFKLTFRDEPFWFMDLKLVRESMEMTEKYSIKFTPNMTLMVVGIVIITVILKLIFDYRINSKKIRFSALCLITMVSYLIFSNLYFNPSVYAELGDKSLINIWSQPQQFQSKGFVYPFIYSVTDAKDTVLEGYDETKAIEDLSKYEYTNIPEDKKVNIIAVMLEAYNDFSKFEQLEFGIDPYKNFHEIQSQSIQGRLVTNIFAGDTIQTERSFITGYNNHPKYFNNTNSFAWYFKEQGYRTEAMHPIYGWFYNRRNVNHYLGFDLFDYYENKYQAIQEEFYNDMDFFDYIIQGYENSKKNDMPYFNFSVTYQNHGPYSNEKYSENQFLKKKPEYNEETYNIINNYLAGISETDKAIKKLVDYFDNEEEPTIVVLFGDHNPWLGKDATGYNMLNIDLDFSAVDGFLNYYETPYIIWGNNAAKDISYNNLVGNGSVISPNLLMTEIFQQFGWNGNEYMQYLSDFKQYIDVNNKVYFKEEGNYTPTLSPENQKKYEKFLNVEYYYSHNFKKVDN